MMFLKRLALLLPWRRRAAERDMQDELKSIAEMARPGELGNLTLAAEDARAQWGWTRLEQTGQDLRYALRTLRKSPAFTATAVLSLALGIGANTALFTLINAVTWRMLPIAEPERLFLLEQRERQAPRASRASRFQQYELIRDHNRVLDLAAYGRARMNVSIDGRSEPPAEGQLVSGSYFSLLGVAPVAGRALGPDDDRVPSGHPVAMISYGYWKRRFALDPAVVGRAISISGVPFTHHRRDPAGVLRRRGRHVARSLRAGDDAAGRDARLGEPARQSDHLLDLAPGRRASQGGCVGAAGQCRAGRTGAGSRVAAAAQVPGNGVMDVTLGADAGRHRALRSAESILDAAAHPDGRRRHRPAHRVREHGEPGAGAVGRAAAGVRRAAGARRRPSRLIRQVLVEGLVLASLAGACGIGLAYLATRVLVSYVSAGRTPVVLDLAPDVRVLAFTAAVSLLTGLLFATVPAFRASRLDMAATGGRDLGGTRHAVGGLQPGRWLVVWPGGALAAAADRGGVVRPQPAEPAPAGPRMDPRRS